ncbi:MAG: hypothetical protein PHX02_06565 [Oscillospiraceae bacterium]|nr:hypothetical protein [Oscillospiraceae bacterium]
MHYETINDNFVENLSRYIGETVTIITQSGGQSGLGFTGVVFSVNNFFVRLITHIGPIPECPLGHFNKKNLNSYYFHGNYIIDSIGSITDIPIDKITSFIHNAV